MLNNLLPAIYIRKIHIWKKYIQQFKSKNQVELDSLQSLILRTSLLSKKGAEETK